EDTLAMLRKEREYRNFLICEVPNEDFAQTILRQFFFDVFHYLQYEALKSSSDETLVAIAEKSIKEVAYHVRYSGEWVIRLGDGTDISHEKMKSALEFLWPFTGELFESDELDAWAVEKEIGFDPAALKKGWTEKVNAVFDQAGLQLPEKAWMQSGGKKGYHTEYMGYILSELQMMQRTYPGLEW
ncbi:MAG: phenylacetate-CoA oxygenase subunit PaaC, partial [Saprospiraceae bacterium]|nr:phenylacetate-CoA oxygenase subunit PaaC [Saprospiraceae bacterium]